MFPAGINKFWQRISRSLYQTDANTVEVANGKNRQALRFYRYKLNESTYERLSLSWVDSYPQRLRLATEYAGPGASASGLEILLNGGSYADALRLYCNGNYTFSFSGEGIQNFTGNFSGRGGTGQTVFYAPEDSSDVIRGACVLKGANAWNLASTNITGGTCIVAGGNGSFNNAGAAHGGRVEITGGTPYGTGVKGIVAASRIVASGQGFATGAKSADYTYSLDDCDHDFNCTVSPIVATLPPVASVLDGQRFIAAKTDSSGNSLTFDASGSETINGAASVSTSTQYGVLRVKPNAGKTAWIQW